MKNEFKVSHVLRTTTYLVLRIDATYLSIIHIAYNINAQAHKITEYKVLYIKS